MSEKIFSREVVGVSIVIGCIVWIATSFFPQENRLLPFMAGAITTVSVLFIVRLLSSAGSMLSGTLFGTGRKVDQDQILAINAGSLQEKAREAQRKGDFTQAIEFFTELLYLEGVKAPERTAFWIAQIYDEQIKDLKQAMYWYRKTIALSCRQGESRNNLYAKESNDAIGRLEELIGSKKGTAVADLVEAKNLIESAAFDLAFDKLINLEKLYPSNAEVDYLLGHYYEKLSNFGMSAEHFQATLQKDPNHLLAAFFLARSQHRADRLLEARDSFNFYIQMAQEQPEEDVRVAEARERLKRIAGDLDTMIIQ